MALFDDDDEQTDDATDSGGWGVDDEQDPGSDAAPADERDPLTDLDTASVSRGDFSGTLKRAIDREAGVVVYAYKNGNAGGLSTVPLSETEVAAEDGSGE
jgi:hypothetical protein